MIPSSSQKSYYKFGVGQPDRSSRESAREPLDPSKVFARIDMTPDYVSYARGERERARERDTQPDPETQPMSFDHASDHDSDSIFEGGSPDDSGESGEEENVFP